MIFIVDSNVIFNEFIKFRSNFGMNVIASLGAFPKSLGFCSGDPESSLADFFDFCQNGGRFLGENGEKQDFC